MAMADRHLFMTLLVLASFVLIIQAPSTALAKKYEGPDHYTFYLHNTLRNFTNENFTAIVSATPDLGDEYKQFGMFIVFEDRLTKNVSFNSTQLGTGRGFFIYDSQAVHVMFMVFTAVIQSDKYNGTIDIIGQNPTNIVGYRYLSVIGGTGDFFLARGLAKLRFLGATRNLVDHQVTWIVSFELDLY